MVVVIESNESDDETVAVRDNPAPPPSSSSSSLSSSNKVPESSADAKPEAERNGYASDGFETASERDVSDDEDGDSLNEKRSEKESQGREGGDRKLEAEQQAAAGADSYEDALNDEELKQKALAQANDAKTEGNKLYGNGQYEEALALYESALRAAPEIPETLGIRSICHSNRAQCLMKLGKYEETVKESSKALELNPSYAKALVRRAEAHEKLENYEEAVADLKKIMEIEPQNNQARRSMLRLEPLAAEKREKMKEEMIGKLKDMGNNILGRFGLSVDNFKAVKDPNTGSYSISFQK